MSMSVAPLHYVPLAVSIAAALTAIVLVWLTRGSRDRLSRYARVPAAFLGIHGLVGVVLFAGRRFELPRSSVGAIAAMLDVVSVVLLAWLVVEGVSAVTELRLELRAAREQATEYERARRDYAIIMRHRVANPLMVVSGGIQTLEALPQLAAADRSDLLAVMAAAAEQLTDISIDPEPIAVEELGLQGSPAHRTTPAPPRRLAVAG